MNTQHQQHGLAETTPGGPPLVSVLIRSIDRVSLADAVASVVSQSYPEWEILVLNDSGHRLESLHGDLALKVSRVIEPVSPLGRSGAANALLDAAHGKYAIFLDDDDWFLPDHLQKLVSALEAAPQAVAAYGDVQCQSGGPDAPVLAHIFDRDFDYSYFQLQNHLPIHSVLFHLDVARNLPACRFDQELTLFEDWDFWLQLAAKGPFKRVPGISAIYALNDSTGSGHAQDDNENRRLMLARIASRQLARWNAEDVVGLMLGQAERDRQINQSRQENHIIRQQLDATAHQLDATAHQLDATAHQLDATAHQLDATAQQLDELKAYSLSQQAEIEKLSELRALHLKQIDELKAYSLTQQAEIEKLSELRALHLKQIDELNTTLANLYQSNSWRLTRPLRLARRAWEWLRKTLTRQFFRNLRAAIAAEIRRQGPVRFVKRLRDYLRHSRTHMARLSSRPPAFDANLYAATAAARDSRSIRLHPDLTGGGETLDASISVVIPTLNAGHEFSWLLRKLRAQRGVRELEIVVVDSGSRDNTVHLARAAGCKVVEIPAAEFTHSHARNVGADAASGAYLLFMVQDAYPIGDYWAYGMLRFVLDHAGDNLVAASCAEYSRSDSDMMYDSMINTHYRFLGCLEYDRIGEHRGDDHMSLRSLGQLSSVACLIPRDCFLRFRYRGDYAEDLDLGIRLIKSGYRVAMLASIKVVHSHNRPAYYYLKRSFVDVIFLVGLFDDFTYPRCDSMTGLLAGIVSTAAHLSQWLAQLEQRESSRSLSEEVSQWIRKSGPALDTIRLGENARLGDDRLNAFVDGLASRHLSADEKLDALACSEARRFGGSFVARLDHFNQFASTVYGIQDSLLRHELRDAVRKTFAAAAGSALGFFYLDSRKDGAAYREIADALHRELATGV